MRLHDGGVQYGDSRAVGATGWAVAVVEWWAGPAWLVRVIRTLRRQTVICRGPSSMFLRVLGFRGMSSSKVASPREARIWVPCTFRAGQPKEATGGPVWLSGIKMLNHMWLCQECCSMHIMAERSNISDERCSTFKSTAAL